jgi:hypothetical protein
MALAPAAVGGCNLIFGVTGGTRASLTGSGGGGGQATTSGTNSTGSSTTSGTVIGASTGTGGNGAGITVMPAAVTLLAQTTLTFMASGAGIDGGAGVTWSIDEAGGGSITPQGGTYTAPIASQVFHVRATLGADYGEAVVTVQETAMPVTIVGTGAVATATGHGSQSHLAYAEGAGEWWLFHDPAGSTDLATRHSKDFASWSDGASVSLPSGDSGDGRDLSVAYRSIAGADVIHVSQGYGSDGNVGRYHLRAIASPGAIAFGTPRVINSGSSAMPDGTSTVILSTGLVIDSTGYQATPQAPPLGPCGSGDVDVYTSGTLDNGSASLDNMMFPAVPKVLWCVPSYTEARQLLAVADVAVHLYVDGTDQQTPTELFASLRSSAGQWTPVEAGSTPTPPLPVFSVPGETYDRDDWVGAVFGGNVHVVRRVSQSGTFEHRIVSTANTSVPGPSAIPAWPTTPATGLALLPYGDGLVLLALDANAASNVVYAAFDGTTWSSWQTLCNLGGASGTWLSGYAPGSGAKPAVIWTQAAGASYAIAGALLP